MIDDNSSDGYPSEEPFIRQERAPERAGFAKVAPSMLNIGKVDSINYFGGNRKGAASRAGNESMDSM